MKMENPMLVQLWTVGKDERAVKLPEHGPVDSGHVGGTVLPLPALSLRVPPAAPRGWMPSLAPVCRQDGRGCWKSPSLPSSLTEAGLTPQSVNCSAAMDAKRRGPGRELRGQRDKTDTAWEVKQGLLV